MNQNGVNYGIGELEKRVPGIKVISFCYHMTKHWLIRSDYVADSVKEDKDTVYMPNSKGQPVTQ